MKRIKIISLLVIGILLVITTFCYASNITIVTEDSGNVTAGSTNTITLKLNSNTKIGGVMGVISSSSNVTIQSVTGLNGWNLTYNEGTGQFNIVKNEGGQNEDFLKIAYTVANSAGTGSIEIKNITASDIENYTEEDVDNFSKNITIEQQQQETTETPTDNTNDNTTGNQTQNSTNNSTETQNEENNNSDLEIIVDSNTTQNKKKKTEKTIVDQKATTAIPKTGIEVGIGFAIVVMIGIAGIIFLRYKNIDK